MKKSARLSRRVVLQSVGAMVALPWLESLRVAADEGAAGGDPVGPPKRFACLFFGDGIHLICSVLDKLVENLTLCLKGLVDSDDVALPLERWNGDRQMLNYRALQI